MFQVTLTAYGQSLISDVVNIDKVVLLYDTVDVASLSDLSSYLPALFTEDACGNLKNDIGNVYIRDLREDSTSYQANTILFCKYDGSDLKPVAGYSQEIPIVKKLEGQILSIYLTFDFSVFTHGFLFAQIQAGYSTAAHNTDGLLHLEDPNIESDDAYSVYSKSQVDNLFMVNAGSELVKGTQTASVAAWTGVTKRRALYEGMTINYFLPYAGKANSTLNLTLANGSTTGAIPIYFRGATAVGIHFPVGSLIQLTYMENVTIGTTTIAAGWFADSDYVDGNTTTYLSTAQPLKAGTNGIYGRCLVMRTGVDTWESIMLSYSSKLASHVLNTNGFYTNDIYYTAGTTTVTSGNLTTATNYIYYNTLTYTNYFLQVSPVLVVGEPVYLVGTIGNDGKFYLKTTGSYQAQEVTTSDIYVYLGPAYSTTTIGLMPYHPMFTLKNGIVVEVTTHSLSNSDRIDQIQNSIPTDTSDLTNGAGFITSEDIPTNVSSFNNDAGYITTETDPTVPSWAKQQNKPSYNLDEVSDGTNRKLSNYVPTSRKINNKALTSDITLSLDDVGDGTNRKIPTKVSDLTNDSGFITSYTETDPTVPSWAKQPNKPSYDLDEVPDGATRKLSNYVPTSRKINNKALTSDITLNLDNISDGTSRKIPTKVSDLTNDSGFITTETDPTVPSWAKQPNKPTYTAAEVGALPDTTVIPTVYNATLTIKKNSSDTGDTFTANASQNKTINLGLSTVATSGSYSDLSNKPTIPTDTANLTNGAGFITAASIPTNVSDFTNDAGYLTTETDPTVPSWAKASSKPSYNLDEVTDGTNRKIPTKVSELTNDSGYITGYTETDPTVPSWAKQPNKPSYTAQEVGALPDSTVIPSNTSDLTNDAGFITSADIPTNVSSFTNDAGYLTSYTETDPTVPSWAKQQNKPSYTLDEVTDGDSRKLSNYVPTSRKVNNKALTSDITLNLDDVADGSSRKLSNYIPYSEVISTINGFDNRRLWQYEVHNTLWAAEKRYDVTLTGFSNNTAKGTFFDGSFETNLTITQGNTGTILIAGKNNSKMWGGGYPYGYLEVAFYYTNIPESVTCRVYSDWATNPGWHDVTLTNVDKNNNNALYRGQNTGFYGVTQMEITVTAKSNVDAKVTEVAFYQTRGTLQQMAIFNKTVAQTLYHNLTAPGFVVTGGTSSQFLKANGSLDSNTYLTSSDLSAYELKSNLKEGAYVDVDETTMTSTSINLPTSKAVASYIAGLNYITAASLPTVNNASLTINKGGTDDTGSKTFTANASTNVTINLGLGAAADKAVDSTIATASTSTNLPTSQAVASFVEGKNYLTTHQSLNAQVATAQYNSTTQKIEFYNAAGTKLNTDIDATDFIKDGMVENVEVTGGNLVISFNTDSGKQDITIPLTDIFDASNYYTKDDIDGFGFLTEHQSLANYVQKVSSTDNAITRFDGTGGAVQNSGVLIDDSNNLLLPLGNSSTFSENSKLVIGNAWFGSNTSGGLAYGVKSGTTYTGKYTFESTAFRPVSTEDNKIDIGTASYRWKNLYIAGKICKNGTYQITVPSASGTMALTSDIITDTANLTNGAGFITAASIPTNVSSFTNDAGYITSASIPTNVSSFTNDAGYITSSSIPTNVSSFTNDAGYLVQADLSTYELKSNLKEGAYVNVDETTMTASSTNLPTAKAVASYISGLNYITAASLPTVNNATLTIQKNGTTVNTFTANASTNVTANITVPTTVAELTDAGDYVTTDDLETSVQDYLEEHQNTILAGNNITITTSSSLLPAGYAQVEYIQSNGASYLDTGLVPTDATKITLDIFNNTDGSFYAVGARANPSSTILLAQSGSSTGATVLGSFNGTSITAKTNNTNWSRTAAGQRYLINLETRSGTGTYSIYDYNNDREFNAQTSYTQLGTQTAHICVLGFNSSNVLGGTSKVYKCEIYQNDLLAFQGIPCYRISDGVYGLYDTVSNTFKTSVTSTAFTGSTEIHDAITISSKDEKAQWGKITGTLSNQTDLNNALGLKANSADLATVATSGSYNDLTNKPTIPTVNNAKLTIKKNANDTGTEFTANASTDVTCNLGLATVATSGSYNDLSNKPTIPTVNNKTITIKKNSSDTGDSFTTNNSTDKTINLGLSTVATSGSYNDLSNKPSIPTTVAELTDASDYVLSSSLATVATSGSYNDLTNKPTIPTVNNASLTINKGGTNDTTSKTFTANASTNVTINLGLGAAADKAVDTSISAASTSTKLPTSQAVASFVEGKGYLTSYTETDPTVPSWAKQSSKPSYDLDEVPDGTNRKIPTKVSDLTNDSGFITSYTETDPTVPSWAKQSSKPTYTASEVGALPDTTVIPSKTSDLTNDSGFITSADVPVKTTARSDGGYLYNGQSVDIVYNNIGFSNSNNLINTSGVTAYLAIRANANNPFFGLKCGSYLWYAQAASDKFYFGPTSTKALMLDPNGNGTFQTGTCTATGFKYKNGSTTGTELQVLIANGTVNTLKTINNESILGSGNITVTGDQNLIESISVNGTAQTITNKNVDITVPTKVSDLTNDSGFITSYTETDPTVPSWAKAQNKPSYTLDEVTDGTNRKLSNYELKSNLKEGAYIDVDETTMTSSSTNLPTSKAVASYISGLGYITSSSLPTVNNSTITIKKNINDTGDSFTLNQASGKTINLGLATVATSGSYNDLTDKPSSQNTLTPGDGIAIDNNDVIRTTGIPFGICDSTSTSTAFTATVPGIYKLDDGVCCMVKNGVVTSASGFTLNVNGLGAKPVYSTLAAASRETTIFNKAYTLILVYDSTRVEGGAWLCYRATDTNAAYVRFNEIPRKPTQPARYYKLYFTSADGTKWVPASKNSTNNATSARAVCQDPIDPFGTIAYSSSSTNYTTSTNVAPSSLWTHYSFTLGYSFNVNGGTWALTVGNPVYIKCAPQTNGSAIMDAETPIVQTLPNVADGKIYIFLGVASAATKVEMTTNHPVYYHDGTGIRIWTGGASSASGGTADKLSNARNLEGVLFDGSEDATHYAYCETAASTQIKDVVIPNFNLTAGARVIVKFKYGNTINDPKLRVNTSSSTTDGTAKDICNAENIPVVPQTNNYTSWEPGYVLEFVYDGTKYIRIGYDEHVVYSSYTSRVDNGQGEGIYGTGTTGDVDYNYVLASDSDILPATTNDFDLGKSDRAWANVYSTKFIKPNGTSSQFLKADGSVDSNTYLTSANLSSYVTTNTTQSITGIKSFYGVKFNYTNTSLTGFGYASDTGIYSTGNGTSSCFMNYAAATTSGEHRFKIANVDKFKINSDGATIYNGGTLSFLNANNTSNYTLSSATSTVTVGEGANATTVTKKHAVCSADIIRSDTDNKTDLGSPSYKFENIYVNNVRTSGNVIPFAKCTTAATTSQKVATLESGDNFTYIDNSLVLVHFSETNLRNNPTLYITGDQSTSNNTVVNNYRKIYFGAYEAASGLDPNDPNYEDTLRTPGHTVWDSWMGGETVLMLCRYGRYYIIGKMYGGMSVGTDTAGANIATSYPRYISAIDARRFASGGDASLQANTSPIGIGLWNHFYNASMDGSGGTQWNKVTQGFIAGWGLGGIIGSAIRGYGYNMQINRGSEPDTTLYTSSSHEGVGSVRMFLLKREVVSYDSTTGTSRCTGYVTGDLVNSDAHYGSGGNDLLEYVECKPVTTVTNSEVTASTTYERKSVFATGTWAMITPTTDIYATSGIYYYLVFAVRVL